MSTAYQKLLLQLWWMGFACTKNRTVSFCANIPLLQSVPALKYVLKEVKLLRLRVGTQVSACIFPTYEYISTFFYLISKTFSGFVSFLRHFVYPSISHSTGLRLCFLLSLQTQIARVFLVGFEPLTCWSNTLPSRAARIFARNTTLKFYFLFYFFFPKSIFPIISIDFKANCGMSVNSLINSLNLYIWKSGRFYSLIVGICTWKGENPRANSLENFIAISWSAAV